MRNYERQKESDKKFERNKVMWNCDMNKWKCYKFITVKWTSLYTHSGGGGGSSLVQPEYRNCCWFWWWCIIYVSHFTAVNANPKTMLCALPGPNTHTVVSNYLPISIVHFIIHVFMTALFSHGQRVVHTFNFSHELRYYIWTGNQNYEWGWKREPISER